LANEFCVLQGVDWQSRTGLIFLFVYCARSMNCIFAATFLVYGIYLHLYVGGWTSDCIYCTLMQLL